MKERSGETFYERSMKSRSVETVHLKRKRDEPENDMRMHKIIKLLQIVLVVIVIGAVLLLLLRYDTQEMLKQLMSQLIANT